MASHLYAVVLAGGRGTRFWPRSRRQRPKQLMNFWGQISLLQQTVERLRPLILPANVWVLTNESLAEEVARQLPEVPRGQIIAEPVQRNTAPCIGLAAELIGERDPEAVLGVFPSDQTIRKPVAFRKVVKLAAQHAAKGAIVVLGITPRWPETGYGYIEFAHVPNLHPLRALPVKQFHEKPSLAVAKRYVGSNRFFWNSGMFFWKASTIREALRHYLPQTAAVLQSIPKELAASGRAVPVHIQRLLKKLYPACENISVDYAVLEKASGVVGIPCDIGWNDVGSWKAVYDLLPQDHQKNVLRTESLLMDSSGLLVDVPGKLVAGIGLKDLVIVETGKALLIVPRDRAQEVSQLVKQLEKNRRNDLL
ncbi:MAG: mannose-1-phosphate guanylyltransferase [Acidobacteria bacterium]|nr:mannose-1-phosphate guanylyltransferase [Acidobacteriota bacterium]